MFISANTAAKRLRQVLLDIKPKRVVIHAGRVKTGSTFLQAAMMDSREALVKDGWLFPESLMHIGSFQSESRGIRSTGHAALARIGASRPVAADLLTAFEREARAHEGYSLLLSAENLGRDAESPRIANLAKVFDGLDVEFLMYLRQPASWVESFYTEQVTGGQAREYRPLNACLSDIQIAANAVQFKKQTEDWETPPKLTFRNYDLARKSEAGVLGDLQSTVGLPALHEPQITAINTSPGTLATEAIRIFNGMTKGVDGETYKSLYSDVLAVLSPHDDGQKIPLLDFDNGKAILDNWRENNIELRDGGYLSADSFDALCDHNQLRDKATITPKGYDAMLKDVCELLMEKGINGFDATPTTSGVGREFRRRIFEGFRRKVSYRFKRLV